MDIPPRWPQIGHFSSPIYKHHDFINLSDENKPNYTPFRTRWSAIAEIAHKILSRTTLNKTSLSESNGVECALINGLVVLPRERATVIENKWGILGAQIQSKGNVRNYYDYYYQIIILSRATTTLAQCNWGHPRVDTKIIMFQVVRNSFIHLFRTFLRGQFVSLFIRLLRYATYRS